MVYKVINLFLFIVFGYKNKTVVIGMYKFLTLVARYVLDTHTHTFKALAKRTQ